MLKETFAELDLSESCYQVFATLLEYGPSSAKQIAERLGINRATTYDYLKALMNRGLVVERFEGSKNLFQVDDPKQLTRLLDEKIERLSAERDRAAIEIPALLTQAGSIDPTYKFYTGSEGVKQALHQVIYSGAKECLVMYSIEDAVNLLGHQNMLDINEKRVRNKMYARGIWSYTEKLEELNEKYNRLGEDSIREVRMAPKEMAEMKMGYWMAGHTTAFISTKREAYGFVLKSKDFAGFLRSQFEMVWQNSTLVVKD